jgi:hypothetical protein
MMKKRTKRYAEGEMVKDESGLPPVDPSLSDDQVAGKMKVSKLRQMYGPTQDERDRRERAELAAEAKGTSPVYRSVDGKSGGMGPVKKMAKGGSASSRADGCCSKGKTKGRMI